MKRLQGALLMALCCAFAVVVTLLHFGKMPYAFAYDPNEERCLPDLHLAFLVKNEKTLPATGDLVFWKPSGALRDMPQEYILKRVAGVPGDHLVINGSSVQINGTTVVSGFPLIDLYNRAPKDFERNEVIPAGHVFVIGTHPLSNDSRYWGYLSVDLIKGLGHKIF